MLKIKKESGQMLLFVLIILLLLFVILIAIVVNIRSDLRSSQEEREYEQAYAFTEGRLMEIIDTGYSEWVTQNYPGYTLYTSTTGPLCPASGSEGCTGNWTCNYKCGQGESGQDCVITKSCGKNVITGETIETDKTLEVDLNGFTAGSLTLTWDGTNTLDLILVYKVSDSYRNVRRVICKTPDSSFPDCNNATYYSSGTVNVTNMLAGTGATSREFLRMRSIRGSSTNVNISGTGFPIQRTILRVQGLPNADADRNGVIDSNYSYAQLSAPEVYTYMPAFKQMPAIFDYVLFVANGEAGHS